MDQFDNDYEIPIPEMAEDARILLIESDIASLSHTTFILEQATYQVTSTEFANVAISFLIERTKEFGLLMVSTDIQGMDCIAFIKTLKILSDIPIVLISRKVDRQLATRTIQLGVCQFINKPLQAEDARGLWQYMCRRGRNKAVNDIFAEQHQLLQNYSEHLLGNCNGESKESEQVMKRTELNEPAISYPLAIEDTNAKQKAKFHQNTIKANAELQPEFVKLFEKGNNEGIPITGQQATGFTELQSLAQVPSHLQNINSGTPTRNNVSSDGINHLQMMGYQEIAEPSNRANPDARYRFQTPGAMSMLPTNNAGSSVTAGQSYFLTPNNFLGIRPTNYRSPSIPYFSTVNGAGIEHAPLSRNIRSRLHSDLPGTSALNLGRSVSQREQIEGSSSVRKTTILSNRNHEMAVNESTDILQGRIDQIRHSYWTDTTFSGKESSLPDTQMGKSEYLLLGKHGRTPFEQVGNGYVSSTPESVRKTDNVLGGDADANYLHNYGLSTANLGSSSLQGYTQTQGHHPNQVSSTFSKYNVQPSIKISSNIKVGTPGIFQSSEYPYMDPNNNSFLPSEGLPNHGANVANGSSSKCFGDFEVVGSSAEPLGSTGITNSHMLNEDELFLDQILAEFRNDSANNDLKGLGFNSGN